MGRKLKKSGKLLTLGVLLASFTLLVSISYLAVKTKKATGNLSPISETTAIPTSQPKDITTNWETYTSPEYGFSIKHPRFLSPRERENVGEYLSFVSLEENDFSQGKGMAIGIRKTGLSEEVEKIKKEMEQGIDAKLVKEEELVVNGLPAARLEYEPETPGEGEARVVVILNTNQYSYSISTTPAQIDKIVASFKLIKDFLGCKNLRFEGDELTFLQSYCAGDMCFPEGTKEDCQRVDVVRIEEKGLSETNGKDGIGDCIWDEKATLNQCRPRF